jgi:hypothetical protein
MTATAPFLSVTADMAGDMWVVTVTVMVMVLTSEDEKVRR